MKPSVQSFSNNGSYVFAGDMNGDGATANDLIYIPRDMAEMNFATFTQGGVTFTAEQQAQAFEAYIQQDSYLKDHRGQYAERGAVFLPMVRRIDLSITQDVFRNIRGKRNTGLRKYCLRDRMLGHPECHGFKTARRKIRNCAVFG